MRIFKMTALLALMTMSLSALAAEKLSDRLVLPDYLQQKYGGLELEISESAVAPRSEVQLLEPVQVRYSKSPSKGGAPSLRLIVKPNQNIGQELAQAFVVFLEKSDENFRLAVDAFETISLLDLKTKENHNLQLLSRVEAYMAARFQGQEIDDEVVALWWKLKFENRDEDRSLKAGDPILFAFRQYGYYEHSDSWLTNVRRRLDFGHTGMAVRFYQGSPADDKILNPGAKDFDNKETTLPNSWDPKVLNMIDVDNFWKWSEVQLYRRYMKVNLNAIHLNALQKQAVRELLPDMDGVNFGPAHVFRDNCADGARRIVNFLAPIEDVISASFLGVDLPFLVVRRSSKAVGQEDKRMIQFTNIAKENPGKDTPALSYKDISIESLEQTRAFQEYLKVEQSW